MTEQQNLERLKRFDEEMRKRFGARWAPPAPVAPEDRGDREETRTKPNRLENEFMLNLMILRNAPHNAPIRRPDETTAARQPILKFKDTL